MGTFFMLEETVPTVLGEYIRSREISNVRQCLTLIVLRTEIHAMLKRSYPLYLDIVVSPVDFAIFLKSSPGRCGVCGRIGAQQLHDARGRYGR